MLTNSKSIFCCLLGFLVFSAVFIATDARSETESTQERIDYLINEVAQSNLTFVRNGEKHTCDEAAGHMKAKYDYLRSKVKSTDDFICLCASKSMLSGQPYLVITQQGTIPVAKWLEQRLAEHTKIRDPS
jgi:hypothetical protein